MSHSFTQAALARRGVRFHWPVSTAIALGVAIATSVITGALVVGDSMRASLQGLTIDRLGRIDQVVVPGVFFRTDSLPESAGGRELHPVILFDRGVVEAGEGDSIRRAGSVQIMGVEPAFWRLDPGREEHFEIGDDEIILNRAAAEDLRVDVGDQVTVRLPAEQAVPADSPLGRRDAQTEGIPRLTVIAVIDNRGLGRFALQPNQAEPMSAWLRRETIAETLQRDGTANALLVTGADTAGSASRDFAGSLDGDWIDELPLELADFGLQLQRIRQEFRGEGSQAAQPIDTTGPDAIDDEAAQGEVIFDYFTLTSDQLLLPGAAADAIQQRLEHRDPIPMLTYLANAIERLDPESGEVTASVPYSTITAIDSHEVLPLEFESADGDAQAAEPSETRPVPVVLNSWTAESLSAEVGDRLRLAYFEPEVEGGREIERFFDAVVSDVVPITGPARPYRRIRPAVFDEPPTVYNDPHFTPTVPGVTDQDSISDWDLPFPLEREIRPEDDRYWNEHRLTPKAFLPLADGRRLFGSRFGDTTSLRIEADRAADGNELEQEILAALVDVRDQIGWSPIAIRHQQLEASRGTTPFDALFLSLSMFVILAALMLIALLFRLGLLQRAKEYGVLLAAGFPGGSVSRLAIREGMWIALPGIVIGVFGGMGYAAAVLAGLRTWWVGAVTVPFLEFHATPQSLVLGGISGAAISLLTLLLTARRLRRTHARELLAGRVSESGDSASDQRRGGSWLGLVAPVLVVGAVAAAVIGFGGSGAAQAGAFVGGGMLLLVASLITIHRRLSGPRSRGERKATAASRSFSLPALAWMHVGRHPLRSTLSIGLMASASFLIVSISAFQLTPTESGVGGFDLIGKTAAPFFRDLGDPSVRRELLGGDAEKLANAEVVSMRFQPGQDASCNNLYQASQPQVLGVPRGIAEATAATPFEWAATVEFPEGGSPWDALDKPAAGTVEDPIPLVLDQNTAMWSLHLRGGVDDVAAYQWQAGRTLHFRVVGLLSNSMLQGGLMIGERNFERHFPHISGYRMFLIRHDDPETARRILESRMGDLGMDVNETRTVLARLMAVHNTYLRTFQSLGALGLLLGTVGLAIAQLRNALERQGELAVMRAIGFARRRLAATVMLETSLVLAAGIGCGVLCAALAVTPYLLTGQTWPPMLGPLTAVVFIALFGLLAGALAVAQVVRMPLVQSLRK